MSVQASLSVGTRRSQLARWQTDHVVRLLQAAWPDLMCEVHTFSTRGDDVLDQSLPSLGGKGLFTAALEEALRQGEIDIAVHSLKDLPVADPPGLTVGAIIGRADVRDVLVAAQGMTLATLPPGAVVGTSSLRRQAQLLAQRPDLQVRDIRGNVETRLRKVEDGQYAATILAAAGVNRLGLDAAVSEILSLETMLPAPGQGALAVQCRAGDSVTLALLAGIHNVAVANAVCAERRFLETLGGGCAVPVAAYARAVPEGWLLDGLVADPAGTAVIRVSARGADPLALGEQLAAEALVLGAAHILDGVKPLRDKRVVVTRSAAQAEAFARPLAALGAETILFPVITFAPLEPLELETALDELQAYDWLVLTSANALSFFFAAYDRRDPPPPLPRIAVIGGATARLLEERSLTPGFMPDEFTGEQLALGLGSLAGQRILLPRASAGRPEIVALLREQGAVVDDIALYDTITAVPEPAVLQELRRGVDVLTFTSPSSVRNFLRIVEDAGLDAGAILRAALVVAIGPVTAAELAQHGRAADIVPMEYTVEGMIVALSEHVVAARQRSHT
jgi:hydroxymethylbilane synthase